MIKSFLELDKIFSGASVMGQFDSMFYSAHLIYINYYIVQ